MELLWTWLITVWCVTLPRGRCTAEDVLVEYQPTGPSMCQVKCGLNSDCYYFKFHSDSLKCILYKKPKAGHHDSTSGMTKKANGHGGTGMTQLPEYIKKLVNECWKIDSKDRSECLADRRNQLRCVRPVEETKKRYDFMGKWSHH